MAYKQQLKERIDLSELGDDSAGNPFFAEIKNPKMMTYDEKMSFVKFAKIGSGEVSPDLFKEMKEIVGNWIVSWNLISIEDGASLVTPSQDATVLDKVPSEVIEEILKSFGNKAKQEDETTKNSSPQSAKSSETDRLQETSTSADTTN